MYNQNEMLPQEGFETWNPPESPLVIECGRAALEEIHRLTRGGGPEVGGILYGTFDERTVRVQTVRPIACEHASGPAFQLSETDKAALIRQLTQPAADSRLEGLTAVGWFVSHSDGQIALRDPDVALFTDFFPEPWQTTMVVRPGRRERAGFFVRDAEGNVQRERSYREFDFPDRLAWMNSIKPTPPPERRAQPRRAFVPHAAGEAAQDVPPTDFAPPGDAAPPQEFGPPEGYEGVPQIDTPAPAFPRRWPWMVTVGLVGASILAYIYVKDLPGDLPPPMDLVALDHDGQLQIHWNPAAPPIQNAASGSIEVVDGLDLKTIPLSASELASGNITYTRLSGEVEIHLAVQTTSGQHVLESSRYIGRPPPLARLPGEVPLPEPGALPGQPGNLPAGPAGLPAPPAALPADLAPPADAAELQKLRSERASMQTQLKQLRTERDQQAQRIRQLELTLKILESRMATQ